MSPLVSQPTELMAPADHSLEKRDSSRYSHSTRSFIYQNTLQFHPAKHSPAMPSLPVVSPEPPTPSEYKLLTIAPCLLCVRVLFALVSVHMVVIALSLWYLQVYLFFQYVDDGSLMELVTVNVVLALWASALLAGGCGGAKAALTSSQAGATRTLGYWLIAALFHAWYLVFGMQMVHRQLYSSDSDSAIAFPRTSWSTIALHVVTDALTTALLILFIALLRAHEEENDRANASETLPLLSPKSEADNEALGGQV